MEFTVRPFQMKDTDEVRTVCLVTAGLRRPSMNRRKFTLLTYCDYYIENEPKNCFVAVCTDDDGNEKVVGYILCAEDCFRYAQTFKDKYLPTIKTLGRTNYAIARASAVLYGRYATFFPAHMHIDILPGYQRQGIGHKLVDALLENLRNRKIKGVMLIVSKKNEKAINFYNKYGFENLGKVASSIALGIEL